MGVRPATKLHRNGPLWLVCQILTSICDATSRPASYSSSIAVQRFPLEQGFQHYHPSLPAAFWTLRRLSSRASETGLFCAHPNSQIAMIHRLCKAFVCYIHGHCHWTNIVGSTLMVVPPQPPPHPPTPTPTPPPPPPPPPPTPNPTPHPQPHPPRKCKHLVNFGADSREDERLSCESAILSTRVELQYQSRNKVVFWPNSVVKIVNYLGPTVESTLAFFWQT